MNNESKNFVLNTLKESDLIIEDLQNYIKTLTAADSRTYMILVIFCEFLQNNTVDDLINIISSSISNENSLVLISQLLKENEGFIKKLKSSFEEDKFKMVKLVDIEWKLIAKASLDMAEVGAYEPTIELKLIYSNGTSELLECDFATFKKLQEDLDIACSSYQTSYSRKVIAFSK